MPFRYLFKFFTIFILLSFCLTGCSSFPVPSFSVQDMQQNAQQRQNLFQQDPSLKVYEEIAHPQILKAYGGDYKNQKLERTIAQIVGNLLDAKETSNQNYRIILLNSPSVNAFALPNGYVYLTRGLLALALDASEVAGVIAHEMAHIIAHHGLLRLQKQEEIASVEQNKHTPLGSLPNSALSQADKLYLAQFTRDQELEADAIGIQILADSGYDPFAIARFLKRMENYSKFRNNTVKRANDLDFLASHPATPQRIAFANERARSVCETAPPQRAKDKFLLGLNGLLYSEVRPQGFIRDHQFISPNLKIALEVPENFTLTKLPHSILAIDSEKTALRFDIVNKPKTINLKDYMQSGWIKGMKLDSLQDITINNISGAYAEAENGNWEFSVIVLMAYNRFYRFLSASNSQENARQLALFGAHHLKFLSDRKIRQFHPLYVRILQTKEGDNVKVISQKMQGTGRKEKFFRLLNDLGPQQELKPGMLVKIIAP